MNVIIQGTNLDLTDDLRDLVREKLDDALRPLGNTDLDPVRVRAEVEQRTHHLDAPSGAQAYRVEATLTGLGPTFRAEGAADDVAQAAVAMKHDLTRQLRAWREKLRDAQRAGARQATRRP